MSLNLQKELEASDDGLQFTLGRRMAVTRDTGQIHSCWALEIHRTRLTKAGHLGKPVYITALVGEDDKGPADLLRTAARMYEQGNVEWTTGP